MIAAALRILQPFNRPRPVTLACAPVLSSRAPSAAQRCEAPASQVEPRRVNDGVQSINATNTQGNIYMTISLLQRQAPRPAAPILDIEPAPDALDYRIQEGRLDVTPQLARLILAHANYERQRPVKAQHVAFLADEMRRGSFLPGTQIAFARMGRRLILVNGQHRLTAQNVSDESVQYQVVIHDVATADAVHALYYRHDRGGRARSEAEVLASVGVADQFGLKKTLARSVFQAQPLIANRFLRPSFNNDPTLRNDDLRLEACKPWWPVAAEYQAMIKDAPNAVYKRLVSSQAVAVALVTIKHQPERAALFWTGLAKDDGLRRNDPRKALLIDFGNREWGRKSSDGCVSTSIAWNAFYTGRPLTLVKIVNGAGVRIAGTPFDGRRA
jgi:hypothetical protein